jgi:hypothetical protein
MSRSVHRPPSQGRGYSVRGVTSRGGGKGVEEALAIVNVDRVRPYHDDAGKLLVRRADPEECVGYVPEKDLVGGEAPLEAGQGIVARLVGMLTDDAREADREQALL